VLDGDPLPLPKGAQPPKFRPISAVAKRLDATWYGGKPRPRRLCVRLGSRSPLKKGTAHIHLFSAHVYSGQMAGWMKTPLGAEVDLGPGNSVLDGDPAPPAIGAQQPPLSGRCLLWPRSPISAIAELLYKQSPKNHLSVSSVFIHHETPRVLGKRRCCLMPLL